MNMRTMRLIHAGLGALAVTSAPAFAATTATVAMSGTAASLCTAGTSLSALSFGTLLNSSTGATSVQTANPSVTDSSAFCNQANTTLKVQRTDLVATGVATSTGFTNTLLINSVTVKNGSNNTVVVTDTTTTGASVPTGTSGGTTSTGAFGAFTNLIISAVAGAGFGGNNLVASNSYAGTITITIVPTS